VADVVPVAHGADIAVIASRSEGTPVCIIEAAAAGRPAVAARTDGVPDIVRPETGLLVPPGDAIVFAEAVQRLVEDKELRERMGRSAREHVLHRYSVDRLLGDIERLYDELIAAAPRHAGERASPAPGPQVTPSPIR
jgi:glycosyltransferase involved in cell wall biosynthesis